MSIHLVPKSQDYPEVDTFTAWFFHRRIFGINDPLEGAPIPDWARGAAQRLDLTTQAGVEAKFSFVGEEGKRRILFQHPHNAEPIPYEDELSYTRKFLHRALTSKSLDIPDTRRAGSYAELVISVYDAHRQGGESTARTAWDMIKRLRPEYAPIDQPVTTAKIRANDLKYLPVPNYLVADFPIYEYGINGLIGASGTGKSFVGVHIAALVACALPRSRSVIYLAFEGLQGYAPRWEAWKAHFRQNADNLIFYSDPVNFMVASELSAFIEQIRADSPALVIVDTVARSMTGADENATRDMGIFVAAVEQLKRQLNCTVLLVHHTNKQGGIRGNSSLYNACDSVLFLKRVGAQIELHNEWESNGKNKHRAEEPTRYLKLLPKSAQVDGLTFNSAVLVEADVIIRDPDFTLKPNDLKVLQALVGFENGLPPLAISESTGVPKTTVYRNLQPLVEHGYITQKPNNLYVITDQGRAALGDD